jgi:hypothetical protein
LSVTTLPVLHLPDEPSARAEVWLAAVADGRTFVDVLTGADGIADWLWSRWRSLAALGWSEADLRETVLDYRRELWLWLVGERTWAQCCSGLIGRIGRRLDVGDDAGA